MVIAVQLVAFGRAQEGVNGGLEAFLYFTAFLMVSIMTEAG